MADIIDIKAILGKDFEDGFEEDEYEMGLVQYENQLQSRSKRLKNVHLVIRLTDNDIQQNTQVDEEPDFTTRVLSCSKYNALADTEKDVGKINERELAMADPNKERLRAQTVDFSRRMYNKAFQADNYWEALNIGRVASYLNPRLLGQSYTVKAMMSWQATGAAHMYKKRCEAREKRLRQLQALVAEGGLGDARDMLAEVG